MIGGKVSASGTTGVCETLRLTDYACLKTAEKIERFSKGVDRFTRKPINSTTARDRKISAQLEEMTKKRGLGRK